MEQIELLPRDPKDIIPTWIRREAEAEGILVDLNNPDFINWFNQMNQRYKQDQNPDDNLIDN